MTNKSAAIVSFIANLLPLYDGECHDGLCGARSLSDGTLILPIAESDDDNDACFVRVRWQGDPAREQETRGDMLATVALERYVRLHGAGASEEAVAAEHWLMARHFQFKTGCEAYLPNLVEPSAALVKAARAAMKYGGGILVTLLKEAMS